MLREDVREHIRKAHRECGFTHLRFHGLFDDDMSVVFSPMMEFGEPVISFYNIDSIFDFLLDTGMKPFVELGFIPTPFASGTQTCMHYKGNVTLPADYEKWNAFIRKFAEHLIERYGKEEVENWPFEVWNEPNLNFFFDGTQEDYFTLYENTVRALKAVDEKIKVGGPATSANAWIQEFIGCCEKNGVPLDFITTHHYPSDDPLSTMGKNGLGIKGTMAADPEAAKMIQSLPPEEAQKLIEQYMHPENKNPGDIRLQVEGTHERAEVFALREDEEVTVFAYNHDLERRNVQKEDMEIRLEGNVNSVVRAVIDENHCNPFKAWENMGSPKYLKKEHLEILEKASELVYEDIPLQGEGSQTISFAAEPESVTISKVLLK